MLEIDGSQGEGGGQVLRTSLSLSALTGRPFRLSRIRAGRRKPGLRPQHLTAVRAAAAVCQAAVEGAQLNASSLTFWPQARPRGGDYLFDVSDAAAGSSAGAVTLIFQTLCWPLLFAASPARVVLRGGTHVPFSPPFHYLAEVAAPAFARLGADMTLALGAWGWNPAGSGEITATLRPIAGLQAVDFTPPAVSHVSGIAAVTNLPAHIPNRMARRAHNLLRAAGMTPRIEPLRATGAGPGAGLVLWLPQAGFSSLGRKGLPADKVAETAVAQLRAFVDNIAAVDPYLADQLLLPLALARGTATYTTNTLTHHTVTNAALLRHWLAIPITVQGTIGGPATITITGCHYQPA